MLSTYINENLNVPYPFFGDTALPFPNSCITGLQLAICDPGDRFSKATFYVSSVTITENSVYLVICCTGSDCVSSGEPVATLSAIKRGNIGTSTVVQNVCVDESVRVNGFLELGIIPDTCCGLYKGTFTIDPSCISIIPNSVMHFDSIDIRDKYGDKADVQQCMNIQISGLFTTRIEEAFDQADNTGNTWAYVQVEDIQGLDLYAYLDERNYTMVESINGVDTLRPFTTDGEEVGSTLSITSISDTIVITAQEYTNGVTVSIKGTSKFKNCFKQDDSSGEAYKDQADTGV